MCNVHVGMNRNSISRLRPWCQRCGGRVWVFQTLSLSLHSWESPLEPASNLLPPQTLGSGTILLIPARDRTYSISGPDWRNEWVCAQCGRMLLAAAEQRVQQTRFPWWRERKGILLSALQRREELKLSSCGLIQRSRFPTWGEGLSWPSVWKSWAWCDQCDEDGLRVCVIVSTAS